MDFSLAIQQCFAALTGGGCVGVVAKFFFERAFRYLDRIDAAIKETHENIDEVNSNLQLINAKLLSLGEHETMLKNHATKLAYLEGMFYERPRGPIQ